MTKQRPVNLDLSTIRFPITAIASILHRISGVIMFVGMGILLALLGDSLSSREGFEHASALLDNFFIQFIIWGLLTALAYHFCAGVRHLFMDLGFGEELAMGELTAKIAFGATVLLSLLAGVLVW